MFWEGCFNDGRTFELKLEYGTVILIVPNAEVIIGYVSDFPDVIDVTSKFENWIARNSDELK